MIFIPIPLPERIMQASCCTTLFYKFILQTVLGMGMGMNVRAPNKCCKAPLRASGAPRGRGARGSRARPSTADPPRELRPKRLLQDNPFFLRGAFLSLHALFAPSNSPIGRVPVSAALAPCHVAIALQQACGSENMCRICTS